MPSDFGPLVTPRFGDLPADSEIRMRRGADVGQQETLREIARWIESPPPWGIFFDKALQVTLAASAVRTEIVAWQNQAGFIGVLRWFANDVGSASDAQYVAFTLLRDLQSVPGYFGIIGKKASSISSPDPLVVPLYPGTRIAVVATNTLASAIQNVSARIKGWVWPASYR